MTGPATSSQGAPALLAAGTVRGHRISSSDRLWGWDTFVIAVGPLPVPPRDDLVAAVRRLADYPDRTRLGWLPDHQSGRWRMVTDLDALADASVNVLPEIAGASVDDLLVEVARGARQGPPVAIWVSGDTLLLAARHAVGDGHHMTRLLAAIFVTALAGEPPASMHRPVTRHALPRALWAQFGRHPTNGLRLARAVAGRRPTGPGAGSVDESDWSASLTCRSRRSAPTARRDLRAWRAQHARGLSMVPLTIAAAELALLRHGIATAADPLVPFDLRRFVHPGGADVPGNFSIGMRVHAAERGDPHAVDAELRRYVALGRPLAVLGAATLPRRAGGRPMRANGGAWDVAYTHVGRAPYIARLPWRDPSEACFSALLPPNGPSGVTIGFSDMGERIYVSASFHDSVIDAQQVEHVLHTLCASPAALLEEHRLGQAP